MLPKLTVGKRPKKKELDNLQLPKLNLTGSLPSQFKDEGSLAWANIFKTLELVEISATDHNAINLTTHKDFWET